MAGRLGQSRSNHRRHCIMRRGDANFHTRGAGLPSSPVQLIDREYGDESGNSNLLAGLSRAKVIAKKLR